MSNEINAPWLKYYGNMPKHLDYPDKTLYDMIELQANKTPDFCAYEFQDKKTSYADFLRRIERTAKAFVAAGIKKGDRVTICMPNSPQALDSFYALNRIGAIPAMIHPLSAQGEITFYLNISKSKAILSLDQFYDKIKKAVDEADGEIKIIVARIVDELPGYIKPLFMLTKDRKIAKVSYGGNTLSWNDFIKDGASVSLPASSGKADDAAAILYSGGTTGMTKGILLSNRNFNATGLQTEAASGYPSIEGFTMLSVMPVFHGFGLGIGIHTALIGGCKCVLVPQFTIKTYANLIKKKKPSFIPGVPTLFEALLRTDGLEKVDLSFLKGVFCGGDSLSVELKKKVDAFLHEHNAKVQIREGYGTTECVTASCLTPPDDYREGSIGIPFPDTYYIVVTPGTTQELPYGEEGEICLSGPSVMIGYMDNEEETASALQTHSDGRVWLHTGDLGKIDSDGFVYFKQRIKRMIITSGYNVYPSQIENVIDSHPQVLYSCVIGVKDPYKMQRIKAYAVLKPGVEATEEIKQEILALCVKNVSKYACPKDIEFRAELPKTLVGKVAYRVLEEEANALIDAQQENK